MLKKLRLCLMLLAISFATNAQTLKELTHIRTGEEALELTISGGFTDDITETDPPRNFMAEYAKNIGVQCGWQPPTQNSTWMGFNDGENKDGLGFDGGGSFWSAIRWDATDLDSYDGWYIMLIDFFPRLYQNPSNFTLMIWEGSNAANLVYQQEITTIAWDQWNELLLDEMHMIDASKELWIGLKVTNPAAEWPMGYDNGPAISGYGDMVSLDGTTWKSMSLEFGLSYNFNLNMFVTDFAKGSVGKKEILTHNIVANPSGNLVSGNLKPAENPANNHGNRSLLGYNVYRNNNQVNPELILGLSYTDAFFTQGTYMYNAKAVYTDGLSEESNSEIVTIMEFEPDIAVTPTSLSETHSNPPDYTNQPLSISNSGNANLYWEIIQNLDVRAKSLTPPLAPEKYEQLLAQRLSMENDLAREPADLSQNTKPLDAPKSALSSENLYTTGCSNGDGLVSWHLENVSISKIPCEGRTTWYHDFTDENHILKAGEKYVLSVASGFNDTYLDVWIDFNDDLQLSDDEKVLDDAYCQDAGFVYSFNINIPIIAKPGTHLMRYRTNWVDLVTDPFETYKYGNCCDFTATTDGGIETDWFFVNQTSGTVQPGETEELTVYFNSTDLTGGNYNGSIEVLSNDPDMPQIDVPVSLFVNQSSQLAADFSALPLNGFAPLNVSFTDLSIGNILQWEWDFDYDGVIDSYEQNPNFSYTQAGTYSVKLTIYDNTDSFASELKEDYITVLPGNNYFEPIWISPFNPMTFYITEATIDGTPMEAGSEVGLFDVDPITGNEICVGAGKLSEPLGGGTYLECIASMDDGSNPEHANGFTPGNAIIYKLWDEFNGEITTITTVYPYPGYDEVYTSQGSAFVEIHGLTEITQCIDLSSGWNLMSFRAMPENPDLLDMVQPLIDDDILYKVLDETGGSIFHLPFPPPNGQWSNTIGNMQATEGYYIKVEDNTEFCIEGTATETPLEIPLTAGWNIVSYPCEFGQDALVAVQDLIDDDVLYKMIDESGGSIFHLPFPPPNGQWSNTIGNLESGKGYYVKVTANTSLTMDCPEEYMNPITTVQENIETNFFHPVYQNNPYMPMHIVLNPCEDLEYGDELAVFDGATCVGATVVDGNINTPIIITVSQNDSDSEMPNGFNPQNAIELRVWKAQSGTVAEIEYEFLEGYESFTPLETMIGALQPLFTDTEGEYSGAANLKLTPNPFSQKTNVKLFLNESATVKMYIQNLSGIVMQEFTPLSFDKGHQSIQIDLEQLGSGVYFLMLEIQSENESKSYIGKLIKM